MSIKIEESRRVALSLLDDLEGTGVSVSSILMKAKRLARLMRDSDAQRWLDLEAQGYPQKFSLQSLGTCLKYAISGARVADDKSSYHLNSLPSIEAEVISNKILFESSCLSSAPIQSMKNYTEKYATQALISSLDSIKLSRKSKYVESQGLFLSIIASIHNYATDAYLAIEFGDIAENIFQETRSDVDAFVRAYCPKAAEKLVSINERMAERSTESLTAALTSCRRLLMVLADALFPPTDQMLKDGRGGGRKLGQEQYKNRLLAYLEERGRSVGSFQILEAEIDHLAARLDAVYEKTCKGVHVDVSLREARLAVIHTYLFIGELAKFSPTVKISAD